MKSKMGILIVGIIAGLALSFMYALIFPSVVQVGDNVYLVKGKYFVLNDPENGMRVMKQTSSGIESKVFIPGETHFRAITSDINPSVMDVESGDLIQMKDIHWNKDSFDMDLVFYRYDGEQLVNVPRVPMGAAKKSAHD